MNCEGMLLMSTVHLINLERVTHSVANPEDVLIKVAERLYIEPLQPKSRSTKLTGPDAAYKMLLLIQAQEERTRKQVEQLEKTINFCCRSRKN